MYQTPFQARAAHWWVSLSIRRGVKSCSPLFSHLGYTPLSHRLFLRCHYVQT